jgi:protein SCO1/2
MRTASSPARHGATLLMLLQLLALSGTALAQRQDHLQRELAGVDVVEHLGAPLPRAVGLIDDAGRSVELRDYFDRGRPLLLSLNYTSCPMLCSLQLSGLARAIGTMNAQSGEDFDVLTLSIDPQDTHQNLARAKQISLRSTGKPQAVADGWHFLAASQDVITAVAAVVGFNYRYDAATGEFRHKATLMVLTPDGRVSRYLHGVTYDPVQLQAALAMAASGKIVTAQEQSSIAGFLLNCFAFNPDDNTPLALQIMRAGGGVSLAVLLTVIGVYGIRDLRRRRTSGA